MFSAINKHNQHLTKHPGAYSAAGAGSVSFSFSFFCHKNKNKNAIALPHGKARADKCKHTAAGRLVLIIVTDAEGDALVPTNEKVA